ncbi:hypothetical protein [Escherichia coli]|uniref:hypothetical protein n=1 Tax=Escherichia coli TaxID=562 RepID=UPI000BE4F21E|nr:hypothetical protein [Escherichia coli]
MKIYRLTIGDLTRAIIAQMGLTREQVIEVMRLEGVEKHVAEGAFNAVINGVNSRCFACDISAVFKAAGVRNWGVKDGEYYADLPKKVPGSGRKAVPDGLYERVLEEYAAALRNGGPVLKRRELAKKCGVSTTAFNRWLAHQTRFRVKGEKQGTRVWDTK